MAILAVVQMPTCKLYGQGNNFSKIREHKGAVIYRLFCCQL